MEKKPPQNLPHLKLKLLPLKRINSNIYNWSDYVDPATLSAFEKNTHINVRYDYYDSNEALEAKLLTGKSGYDLVAPSIANVGRQIKAGAYQKIDKSKIPDYANIDPDLLKMMEAVDPGQRICRALFLGHQYAGD